MSLKKNPAPKAQILSKKPRSISMSDALWMRVKSEAKAKGFSVSKWIAEACEAHVFAEMARAGIADVVQLGTEAWPSIEHLRREFQRQPSSKAQLKVAGSSRPLSVPAAGRRAIASPPPVKPTTVGRLPPVTAHGIAWASRPIVSLSKKQQANPGKKVSA